MTAREHNRILGILFYIYAALQGIALIIAAFFFFIFIGIFAGEMRNGEEFPLIFITVMMVFASILSVLLIIPIGLAGYKILNQKSNAKIWGLIASIIAILNIPLGTALGVYGLWFLLGDNGRELYDGGMNVSNNVPPPPPNSWQ